MAKTFSKIGVATGQKVKPFHVSQSIDAFTGIDAYDISLSGSFNMTGSINGEPGVINPLTASYAMFAPSASYALSALSASYAISASYEIIKEVSSSHANFADNAGSASYADTASFAQSGNGIFSGSFSGSFSGDGSGLTDISIPTGAFGIANTSGSYTYYSDFQTAINAASAGETVEMFADVTETSAVTVTLKNGVNINGNGHTYELNTADATPAFITPNSTANFDIAIQNMIISRSNSTTTAGYCIGIGINTTGDLDLTGTIVNNTGAGYGITAVSANGNMQINNATVYTNSATAIFLNGNSQSGAKNCIAYSNSGIGIRNSNGKIINCFGQSTSGIGISNISGDAINCTGVSGGTDGFQNQARAFRCTGISTGGAGYYSVNSGQNHNCTGYSSASYGFRTLGTGNHIISNCSGYSTANAGMFLSQAVRANNCFAYSTVNNAYGGSGTANLYNCTGESLAAVTVTGVNDIYNCSLKCEWNDAGGHVINTTSVSLNEYFNNTLITTNASANAIYSLNAQTAYIGSNVYKGMTTPINANITNIQSNTPDAYGNVLIG